MLNKFLDLINDRISNISKKDAQRLKSAMVELAKLDLEFNTEVKEYIKNNIKKENYDIFITEIKKFYVTGKTTLKLPIEPGDMNMYQLKIKVT